jgi:nitrite reductase/ring-hydroxylating ferredoxin subunit
VTSSREEVSLTCPTVAEGEREIIDGPNGPVLVTKVAGTYYAVDAKCPHLNLPMKKGKISNEGGVPTLTCNFHNSCFEMKSGKCTKWVTGALGKQNEVIGGIMSSVGSEQKDIVAYSVSEADDGTLRVVSQIEAS